MEESQTGDTAQRTASGTGERGPAMSADVREGGHSAAYCGGDEGGREVSGGRRARKKMELCTAGRTKTERVHMGKRSGSGGERAVTQVRDDGARHAARVGARAGWTG